MNIKIFYQFIIFLGAFLFVFAIPKPDLRIEKIKHKANKESNTLIVGNSILEHQSVCDIKGKSISDLYKDFSIIGEGGILLEEIFLSLGANKNKKNLILITAPYQYSQPLYYPLQSHIYYSKKLFNDIKVSDYPVVKKNLWRLNESIVVDENKINRGEASLTVKKIALPNHCNYNKNINVSLLDELFKHTNNYFAGVDLQINLIEKLSINYNLSIILVPIYLDDFNSTINTRNNAENQIVDIEQKLRNINLKLIILNTNNDITFYDEPWCMCGHLSQKGRALLENEIQALVNNR